MNKSFIKGMFLTLVVVYVLSPVDLLPGPIDDVLAVLFYVAAFLGQLHIGQNDDDEIDEVDVIDVDDN